MFTGIIEETGTVVSFEEQQNSWRLVLAAEVVTKDLQMGDSVAVNGCCLTAVAFDQSRIEFDLLGETKRLTSIDRRRARWQGEPRAGTAAEHSHGGSLRVGACRWHGCDRSD